MRMTARPLIAPSESFGSAQRADRAFEVLREVIAQYVARALAQRRADETGGQAADPRPPRR